MWLGYPLIPPFDNRGMLPSGLYDASLEEIRRILGFNDRRKTLVSGLERYLQVWDRHQVLESAIVDGSFVTDKVEPCDIDLLVVPKPEAMYSQIFVDLVHQLCDDRNETKEMFGCEAFPVSGSDSANYRDWLRFFSEDRKGDIRGLVKVRLPL